MGRTKVKSEDLTVNKNIDMNGKRAVNAEDAQAQQDYVTNEQLEEAVENVAADMEWKATQW
jgi:hypothetical protein